MGSIHDLAQGFENKKIVLVGDTIVDHYVHGTVIGTSAETPTLVARELEQKRSLGGSFLVCRNLLALQAHVAFFTLLGQDPEGSYAREFQHDKLSLIGVSDPFRKTTVKRRFWVDGYKLLQFDQLDNRPIEESLADQVAARLEEKLHACDALIFSDYRHGFLTPYLIERLLALAKQYRVPTYVDSQVSQSQANHLLYSGAAVVCLNAKEAQCILPAVTFCQEGLGRLRQALGVETVVVKLGDRGSVALSQGQFFETPSIPVQAKDTCGAGDAFLAALAACGMEDMKLALNFANLWGGLSATLHGPEAPTLAMVRPYAEALR